MLQVIYKVTEGRRRGALIKFEYEIKDEAANRFKKFKPYYVRSMNEVEEILNGLRQHEDWMLVKA